MGLESRRYGLTCQYHVIEEVSGAHLERGGTYDWLMLLMIFMDILVRLSISSRLQSVHDLEKGLINKTGRVC